MHTRRAHRSLLVSLVIALLAVGATACASSDDDPDGAVGDTTTTGAGGDTTTSGAASDTTTSGAGGGDELVVVAKDLSFTDLTVQPGEAFVLDNQDGANHTLTADEGEFDSGEVSGGTQSDPLTAPDAPGDYLFHCEIHGSMAGTLSVAA